MKKRGFMNGFTLAETMITLTIIGVIASLTVPNLMRNYNADLLRTQFLAANTIVKNTQGVMIRDRVNIATLSFEGLKEYFKGVNTEKEVDRWGHEYWNINHTTISRGADSHQFTGAFNLANGMTVWLSYTNDQYAGPRGPYYAIVIDVNGVDKKPNRYGRDVFFWYQDPVSGIFSLFGSADVDSSLNSYSKLCDRHSNAAENGCGCGYRALTEPDYFKNLDKNFGR